MARTLSFFLAFCMVLGVAHGATSDDFTLTVRDDGDGVEDGIATGTLVATWAVNDIQGWSLGVCHDEAVASIGACTGAQTDPCGILGPVPCANVTCAADMVGPGPTGQNPDFHSLNVYPNGLTQGIVLSFLQLWDLDADSSPFELLTITYDLAAPGTSVRVDFCSTLGQPPVETTMVVGGGSFPPAVQTGATLPDGGDVCTLSLGLNLAAATVAADSKSATVPVLLTTGDAQAASGFQFGMEVTSGRITGMEPGAAVVAAGGADFFGYNQVSDTQATLGVAIDLEPDGDVFRTLVACAADQEVAVATVDCGGAAGTITVNTTIEEGLGTPPVAVVVDVDGDSLTPAIGAGISFQLICVDIPQEYFVRGDANQDGMLNVSDAVAIAKAVFGQGSKLPLIQQCMDSADVNDDGAMNTADAIYLLEYLFIGGQPVPAPNTCGVDPTTDTLDCPEYPPCEG